jgi:hypothetical protein
VGRKTNIPRSSGTPKSKFAKRRVKRRRARIKGTDDPKRAQAIQDQLRANKHRREAAKGARRRAEATLDNTKEGSYGTQDE